MKGTASATEHVQQANEWRRFKTNHSLHLQETFGNICVCKHPIFQGRDPNFIEMLTSEFLVELYPEGSIIIEEGTVADRMFFLNHGRVEVNSGRDMAKVAVLQEGSIFGEMACLGGLHKRQCTVRALEFCDCRSILRWSFEALLKRFPTERAFFAKLSDRRFKKLTQVRQNDNNTGMKGIASKWQGPGRRKVAPETATFCDSRTPVSKSSPLG
eukprot:CAMPEP_0194538326 /NCGR_PEP_ID=MMETSP0253-20130528/77818_1 /TAXON_ID=2966 /ORGANISM="Noctiluca scintillans" /LENGTH=212 /DNA_ID=CAMNT_0039384427 /DNA_START=99 /DNA_END=734 /DNA_ORIENTATION=+